MANLVRSLGREGIVDVQHNGVSFRLRKRANAVEDGILVRPGYNRAEIEFLSGALPPGGTFVDLGANVGLYSLPLARRIGPSGRVLSVDTNPDIARALAFNIQASGLSNITIACVAVGETRGRARLEICHEDLAIVEIHEDPNGDIEIKPLADIVRDAGLSRVDALKADIEGFEDRAILPFLEQMSGDFHPRRIVVEHLLRHVWKTDCFPAFERFGYRLVRQTRCNALFEKRRPG
jgi:FkbM family methyltransferase